jgi:hypothetical protein
MMRRGSERKRESRVARAAALPSSLRPQDHFLPRALIIIQFSFGMHIYSQLIKRFITKLKHRLSPQQTTEHNIRVGFSSLAKYGSRQTATQLNFRSACKSRCANRAGN